MSSGIKPTDEALVTYTDLQAKHKYHYVVFKISDDKSSVVMEEAYPVEQKFDYKDFKNKITTTFLKDPRYIVLDYHHHIEEENRTVEKVVFIYWSPDKCGVQTKMMYASAVENVKKSFVGIGKSLQANDASDLDEKEVIALIMKK